MEILHVAAECYPFAKAGGLADVVGALPKYQQQAGQIAKVVTPMYKTKFLYQNTFNTVHKGAFNMANMYFQYTVIKEATNKLGFDFYCVDINGLLDRENIYGYADDAIRFTAFQIAVVDWLSKWQHKPTVVHVHDYHAGLIPFIMKHCYAYNFLSSIKTVLTIHNGQYQGWLGWDKSNYLPPFDAWKSGLLEWDATINPLASAVKCADKVTTVSPTYMQEIKQNANGLEKLFEYEQGKCVGILNGIDYEVWDPATDTYLAKNYTAKDVQKGKLANKQKLCTDFGLDINQPLFIFIGRLVGEKAAEILADTIKTAFYYFGNTANFLILGSGEKHIEHALGSLNQNHVGYYNSTIGYNEALAHNMYAAADFLLMPSRVEPCGLNQMYALRYGTIPLVRRTGGLADTVVDYGEPNGYGICFNNPSVEDLVHAISRALTLYQNKTQLHNLQKKVMGLNNSWQQSAQAYYNLYFNL
jgi:starch synthase